MNRRDFIKRTAALTAASYIGVNLPFGMDGLALGADADTWVRGTCRLCGAGCRVELGLNRGKPVALRGVADSRTNLGYLCMKGTLFHQLIGHPDRLTEPLYRARKDQPFQAISWDRALDIAAGAFAGAVKAHGSNAVAYYGSGQCLTEETYLFQKVMRGGLRTNNVEGNPRLCMASAVGGYLTSFGADEPIGSYADIEKAECFFLIGSNMAEAHPVIFRRLLKRKQDNPGIRVINADPRISPTSRLADLHLQFRPGTDLALLNAMAWTILDEGLHDPSFIDDYCLFKAGKGETIDFASFRASLDEYAPEKTAAICGGNITPETIRTAARWFAKSAGTMSMWCMGINQRQQGVWANNLIHNLHLLTGQLCKPGADSFSLTGQPNACGGVREAGGLCHILPGHRPVENEALRHQVEDAWGIPRGRIPEKPGLHTLAMFQAVNEGKVKAIWINCTSPAQSLPNADLYREGLRRDDVFVICSDIFPTRTTELANLILPTAFHFEKTGVYGCTERRSQITPKAVDPPGEARPEVWIVREWALRLARELADPVIARTVEPFAGLEPEVALPEAIWTEYIQKLTRGRDSDLGGATYRVLRQMPDGVQWPAQTEEFALSGGTVRKFVRGLDPIADKEAKGSGKPFVFYGPAHPDRKLYIWQRKYVGAAEEPDGEYPMYLSNGRVVDHWHTTSMTGRIPALMRSNPWAFIEINPKDAARLGIAGNDLVEVESRRGRTTFPARIVEGPVEGMVFVYWHDMDEERMINRVTMDAFDPGSKEPEFKISACRIRRVSGPKALRPFVLKM